MRRSLFFLAYGLSLALSLAASGAAPNELTDAEKTAGWQLLFDGKTTNGWHSFKRATFPKAGWDVEGGWLHCTGKKGGDIVSQDTFDQFDLTWEWKLEPAGNSGLKYFVSDDRGSALGHEYQMLDDNAHPDAKLGDGKRVTGSFYDVIKPTAKVPVRPMGEINESRVLVKGNHVEHWLNGTKVLEYECGSKATTDAVAASKFKTTDAFGTRLKGHILLQDHNCNVWFRNIKIRSLAEKPS
jgi:hypothetical protein